VASGWVVFGLGAAAFVAGVVTGALALQTSSALDQRCVQRQCAPPEHAQVDAFHALRAASTGCFAASGAVLGAGIAVLLTVPSDEPASTADTGAEAALLPVGHGAPSGVELAVTLGPARISLGGVW
jgi:hypothetical protein